MSDGLSDRPVYRTRALPSGDLQGRYLITEQVLEVTRRALTEFALLGIRDGGHEGLVLWAGKKSDGLIAVTTVLRPRVEHSYGGVHVTERDFASVVRQARASGVILIGQVHSHPGADTRHSDGDDELIALPTEGLLSIVAPDFGTGLDRLTDASIHQYQAGRWVLCSDESVRRGVTVAPAEVDAG